MSPKANLLQAHPSRLPYMSTHLFDAVKPRPACLWHNSPALAPIVFFLKCLSMIAIYTTTLSKLCSHVSSKLLKSDTLILLRSYTDSIQSALHLSARLKNLRFKASSKKAEKSSRCFSLSCFSASRTKFLFIHIFTKEKSGMFR